MSKYIWIIENILRTKKISFKELNELWLHDLDISRGEDIPKRTFDNWRYAIWDIFGINIVNENHGEYRYYIENEEDIVNNGLRSWLFNTFCVSNVLSGSLRIKDRIILEYVPSGQEYLQPIVEAMKSNNVVTIVYRSYLKNVERCFDVQPFCVKLYYRRWYLIARGIESYFYGQGPRVYALDRIVALVKKDETFDMPKNWDASGYFEGCFGITTDRKIPPQNVKLKVSASQANYMRDLKLHESQQEVERNQEFSIFTFFIRPGLEFQQEILRNGEYVEVLEPEWLRCEISGVIRRMLDKYKTDNQ